RSSRRGPPGFCFWSWRNVPAATAFGRSRFVAATISTSTFTVWVPPTRSRAPAKHAVTAGIQSHMGEQRGVIPGGGFGGVYTALELEKALAGNDDVQVTLVTRDNFFLFT